MKPSSGEQMRFEGDTVVLSGGSRQPLPLAVTLGLCGISIGGVLFLFGYWIHARGLIVGCSASGALLLAFHWFRGSQWQLELNRSRRQARFMRRGRTEAEAPVERIRFSIRPYGSVEGNAVYCLVASLPEGPEVWVAISSGTEDRVSRSLDELRSWLSIPEARRGSDR